MTDTAPAPGEAPPRAAKAETRLLLPFLFERRAADRAAEALAGASSGLARGIWTREPPRKLYRYRLEMTGQLDRFLFSHGEKGAVEGAYLHASGERIRRWLGTVGVDLGGGRAARVQLSSAVGVEIFLTAHGAGVLSLAFDLGADVDTGTVLEVNRRLSILTRPGERAPWLTVPAADGAPTGAAAPASPGAAAAPPPAEHGTASVPLGERLGKPGAHFSLAELIAALLEPLRGLGVAPIQESLVTYAVVAFPRGVHVGAPASRTWSDPLLSALAQAQPAFHPAPPEEVADLEVPSLLVARNHRAAASLQGAAHLLSPREAHATDEDTVGEARDRWFVPWLTALLQRCAIKKAAEEATDMVVRDDVRSDAVSRLRSDVLAFALAGALPEVSVRQALHRYYRMCQEAVDIDRNLEQVRSALGDLEAQLSGRRQVEIAEAQRELAHKSAESQESSHRIHMALVWIEVFIVVAYAAELVKFFVIELPHIHEPAVRWTAGILSVATGVVALAVLRPWDHRHVPRAARKGHDAPAVPPPAGGAKPHG